MKTIIFVALCLCLVVSTISAEKSHKHGDNKKLLKSGGHEHQLKEGGGSGAHKLEHIPKSALPLKEEPAVGEQKPAREGRKHHRHGKNRKGGQQAGEHQQQTRRSRKAHSKSKANQNGPTKSHHNKHARKQGRGKQVQQ